MNEAERKLLDKAITTLICALAHDEAVQCGAPDEELDELRRYWVPDAEEVVEAAKERGLLGDDDD